MKKHDKVLNKPATTTNMNPKTLKTTREIINWRNKKTFILFKNK